MNLLEIFHSIVINGAIAHGLLIPIYIFFNTKKFQSGLILSLLLIDLSLIVFRIYYVSTYMAEQFYSPFFSSGPFIFLLGPLLYLYLRSIVENTNKLYSKDILHFIPFVIYLSLLIPYYLLGQDSQYSILLKRILGSPWLFLVIQFIYYLVQARRLVKTHQKNIVQKFSNVSGRDTAWMKLIFLIFIVVLLFITIATPWIIHGINLPSYYLFGAIFFSLLLYYIAFKGLMQRTATEMETSPDNTILTDDQSQLLLLKERLLFCMENDKPYLNPELTLTELARQLKLSRNQLSMVINNGIGDNFYNFVNNFRIEEVKRLIQEDNHRKYTLLALAQDAGFNSKSTFNNIFKKSTGLTPSEYRDGHK